MDEIYVGYLPVPSRLVRFLKFASPVLVGIVVGLAYVVATSQRSPGQGVWQDSTTRTFSGVVVCNPYPTLFTTDRGDGSSGAMLLVESGKRGSRPRMAEFDGKAVTISGTILKRDNRHMVELAEGKGSVIPATMPAESPLPKIEIGGRVVLRGEIVDSKCYLGAMKPGEGKTHKECATLCISGGIPPMLVTRGEDGVRAYYLLLDREGGPLSPEAFPYIADQVEISGDLEIQGDMKRIRVDVGDIRRL